MNERDEHPLAIRLRLAKVFADLFFLGVGSFALVATFEQGGHALETEGLIIAAFFAGVTWLLESRFIRSIEVSQDELTFRARSRTIAVPWPILRSVTVAGRNRIRWRWDGDSVTTPLGPQKVELETPLGYQRLEDLLHEVREQAPHVAVEVVVKPSWTTRRSPPGAGS
jgi:hypothetical protein